ncbi:hypothetical protein XENTR_v10020685 [Xenopus tropicalis]|nr:hypothetical protein XENTR_v10020680 [Xenopus tropicalis]KAE8583783.1 hypothetical protein XENTR_v10020685 [Xenopus tropicalis]
MFQNVCACIIEMIIMDSASFLGAIKILREGCVPTTKIMQVTPPSFIMISIFPLLLRLMEREARLPTAVCAM